MKNPPVIDRLVNTLFPEEPVLNINDDADASLEHLREQAENRAAIKQSEALAELRRRVAEAKQDARDQQDRHSKHQPLTEVEALWRIERAILRVAHALEASNDRD